jgi:hypothetical protein
MGTGRGIQTGAADALGGKVSSEAQSQPERMRNALMVSWSSEGMVGDPPEPITGATDRQLTDTANSS